MLVENLENLVKRERSEGREESSRETAHNLIRLGILTDVQIAQATGLPLQQVQALHEKNRH
ncbi:hypothetical protein [Thiorhodovibrio frisius]|uniref:hypothetical protein n=1 Tax=Thiorhodovibrio frisius TaxID=631362 RepID=UPI00022C677D|nr:hypothetical protein [Thiorhodovibrio frisius]WPL23735.1 hypothetical protein Thiofri_03938 [Thiorhodovibrio frisius]